MPPKRKRINVAGIEDLTTVVRARTLAVVGAEWVRYTAEVARRAIDQVRVGVCKLGGKTPLVLKADTCLQRVIVRVGLVLFLVDGGETRVDTKFVRKDLAALVCIAIRVRIRGGTTQPAWINDLRTTRICRIGDHWRRDCRRQAVGVCRRPGIARVVV